eukprot:TRINITY_DN45971_c0_g1_i2.p1 TRINITY_DN45971_c0_g1~~TRINITY_DN45971_c0_g1_i2.p1  ORF type:complete len:424 (-),score=82.73 TRINITY_DN45971_c0_g1_i2:74-1345(-)
MMPSDAGGALPVRSSLRDERIERTLARILLGGGDLSDDGSSLPRFEDPPAYDWASIYAVDSAAHPGSVPSFVGAVDVKALPQRGLGLVAARDLAAGELLLVEPAWALGAAQDASKAGCNSAELLRACQRRLAEKSGSTSAQNLERVVLSNLHGDRVPSGSEERQKEAAEERLLVFRTYLAWLRSAAEEKKQAVLSKISLGDSTLSEQRLSDILGRNARKTESWDAWTLLVDESKAGGGLWLLASLFNHSCLGNVNITYAYSGFNVADGRPDMLVARAAVRIAKGEELCHTYIYPFETVTERRGRLERSYGFVCGCDRCALEAPRAKMATELADALDACVNAFSGARTSGEPRAMKAAIGNFRKVLQRVDESARALSEKDANGAAESQRDASKLWKAQDILCALVFFLILLRVWFDLDANFNNH